MSALPNAPVLGAVRLPVNTRPRHPVEALNQDMEHTLRCGRCGDAAPQDLTSADAADWAARWQDGRLTEVTCPKCQTPLDAAEAEANGAQLRVAAEDGAHFVPDPVVCMTGTVDDPGTVLYGADHLRRIQRTGQAEHLAAVEHLPEDTRCVPSPGGVLIHLPR